jgi:glycosyltransferase involved in cell wall biosynthesis
MSKTASKRKPDVCLLLEGTYPYVSGGVSTWVHQIITALPEIQFSLFFIGSEEASELSEKYKLPSNVVSVEKAFLHDPTPQDPSGKVHDGLVHGVTEDIRKLAIGGLPAEQEANLLLAISQKVQKLSRDCNFEAFWKHPSIWALATEVYEQHASDEPFLNFYYAVKALCEPMGRLITACTQMPPARMYHSLCTGYSGFAAGLASSAFSSSYLLSEHGIYVRERIAELQKARWILDTPVVRPSPFRQPGLIRLLWIQFFKLLGRFAYETSNYVTSLFQKNALSQIEFGADPRRIEIIPNGINVPDFYEVRGKRRAKKQLSPGRMHVGFLGRVVAIKDVKTLIKSARIVINKLPQAKFLIAGPMDEEPEYAADCQSLAEHLGLQDNITFLGSQKTMEFLPELDLMLLTSVSEGLPFVVLESFAAGVPVISTDVGACREMIEGRPEEEPNLGPGGFVVPVGNAEMLGAAMIRILTDEHLGEKMGNNGRARAETHYASQHVQNRYRHLYQLSPKDFSRSGLVAHAHQKQETASLR